MGKLVDARYVPGSLALKDTGAEQFQTGRHIVLDTGCQISTSGTRRENSGYHQDLVDKE